MEEYINAYSSLRHYFDVLEQTGNYDSDDTKGLLLYCFVVDQVFNGPLSEYLDDEGLNSFNKMLNCLYRKGCLINKPASDFIRIKQPTNNRWASILRNTEDSDLRTTQEDEFRRTE